MINKLYVYFQLSIISYYFWSSFLIKFSRKKNVKSYFQKGKATYFSKISNKVSELNINKSIKNQINKIRTRDNKNFPACFYYKKRKYIIKENPKVYAKISNALLGKAEIKLNFIYVLATFLQRGLNKSI